MMVLYQYYLVSNKVMFCKPQLGILCNGLHTSKTDLADIGLYYRLN